MMRNKEKPEQQNIPVFSAVDMKLLEMQADICHTLANPKRLQILNLLKEGELSVGSMERAMGVAKPNLSQHLGVMRQKGILLTRREGTTIYYRLALPQITEACRIMREVLLESLLERQKVSRSILDNKQRGVKEESDSDAQTAGS
jgi:DNA-binding transcriptional ArsR family regulator